MHHAEWEPGRLERTEVGAVSAKSAGPISKQASEQASKLLQVCVCVLSYNILLGGTDRRVKQLV